MPSDAQNLYLTEVLGLNPSHFVAGPQAQATAPRETVVMTAPLSPEDSALLTKILSSIGLKDYRLVEGHQEIHAARVLVFGGELAPGRHQLGNAVWWSAPALSAMTGQAPHVTENKKFTWTLLQQMTKE